MPENDGLRVIKIPGKPSARQKEFFSSNAKYTAYGGARGGGKSWALRRKLVLLALRYKGIRILLVRRTLPELKSNHLQPLLAEYPDILTYVESDKAIYFPGGSAIYLGYCSCDRDVLRYQGQEYDVIAIDEATQLSEYQFSIFKASLRGVNDFPKRIYLTCNPGGIGHAWVKRLFIDRDYRESEDPMDYRFIPATVYDNDALLLSDPSYVEQLRALPERLKNAWLYGRWDVFEGQFFSEFNEGLHVVEPSRIPKTRRHFIAFDYGLDMLALLMLTRDLDGNLYVVKELMRSGLTLGEASLAISDFCDGYDVEFAVASPDLWNRRQDTGKSGFEIMQRVARIPPLSPADDRRIPGWRVLKEYLSVRDGKARLYISSECRELIYSMESLLCDRTRAEDASSEPHSVTHAPEALRYAVMSRFEMIAPRDEESALPFRFSNQKNRLRQFLD